MQIEVRIFGNLREYVKDSENPLSITVHKDATVLDLLKVANIPLGKVNIIFVNARQAHAHYKLRQRETASAYSRPQEVAEGLIALFPAD